MSYSGVIHNYDNLLTVLEAATILGLTRVQIWRLIQNKWFDRVVRVGAGNKKPAVILIPKEVVMGYVGRKKR
jgi:predicted DNA-binding transcriptional regulator AlpA